MLNPVLNLFQNLVQHLVKSIGYETLNPSRITAGRQVQGDSTLFFDSLDVCANPTQLLFYLFVPSVEMVESMYYCFTS